jgi:CCR4-NOT transcription complex subunit 1
MKTQGGQSLPWVDAAMSLVRQCVLERTALWSDFGSIFDALGKAAQRNPQGVARKIHKFVEDLKSAAAQLGGGALYEAKPRGDSAAREQVTYLLEHWIRLWTEAGGQEAKCVQFIALLHQQNILKSEEMSEVFLRLSVELCVDACMKTERDGEGFNYSVVDALGGMLVMLVKYGSADPQSVLSRVQYLNRILGIVARAVAAGAVEGPFDQRPFLRLLTNLLKDLNTTDPVVEANNLQVLGAFAAAFHALQPSAVPAFALAWLELVSHRSFMPALLLAKPAQKGWMLMHRILVALLIFLEPFLRRSQLPPAIRTLYKGTLRVLLVLLHDFPEFLCDYHFSFCDVIPPTCIQLRNLFLSAFPRTMRLPDPFTPNLKVDLLPEIAQHPRILSNIVASLGGLRVELDAYLKTQQPKAFLEWLPDRLRHDDRSYNVPAINSLVVYVGAQGIVHLANKALTHSPVMEVLLSLIGSLDAEGRYVLLNAIANQLRFPNQHTHYFSCVLLFLFAETTNEFVKEQITRCLLERLIVHRPHPWGLLITFIELIKNPRYNFWSHKFTHCAPEIEKVFESVARSCMGPGHVEEPPAAS